MAVTFYRDRNGMLLALLSRVALNNSLDFLTSGIYWCPFVIQKCQGANLTILSCSSVFGV